MVFFLKESCHLCYNEKLSEFKLNTPNKMINPLKQKECSLISRLAKAQSLKE